MAKYNFHDYPHGRNLPDDINDPIKKVVMDGMKCPEIVTEIEDLQKHGNCGGIEAVSKKDGKSVDFECNFGVFPKYFLYKTIETPDYFIRVRKQIKNHYVDMKNHKKVVKRH